MLATARLHILLTDLQQEDVRGGQMPGDRFGTRLRGLVGAATAAQTASVHQGSSEQTAVPAGPTAAARHRIQLPPLTGTGRVAAWGWNDSRQTDVPTRLTPTVAIAAGYWHSLALYTDGTVTAWGNNYYGQTDVPTWLAPTIAIAAGWEHSLALHTDGTITAWGNNGRGQAVVPTWYIPAITVAIAAGADHSLALA